MKHIRQIIRGCGSLPHVGPHPGTAMLVAFVFLGFVAGMQNSFANAIGGALLMLVGLGGFYLAGAYSRAKLSDALERRSALTAKGE